MIHGGFCFGLNPSTPAGVLSRGHGNTRIATHHRFPIFGKRGSQIAFLAQVVHTFYDHGRRIFKLCSLIQAFRVARLLRDSSNILRALQLSVSYVLPAGEAQILVQRLQSDQDLSGPTYLC
jgi:hypothetical protein